MLVKQYGEPEGKKSSPERRYSPAVCTGAVKTRIEGNPDPAHVSTSHIERANVILRRASRRFTRLTNAFSKKFENHVHMVASIRVLTDVRCVGGATARPRHPNKEIEAAIEYAEAHKWTVVNSNGHARG